MHSQSIRNVAFPGWFGRVQGASGVKPIKVCVVVSDFPLLSETFIVSQISGLMAQGFDVTVVCDRIVTGRGIDLASDPFRQIMPVTVFRWLGGKFTAALMHALPAKVRRYAGPLMDVLSDFKLNRYDVLLAHFGTNGRRLARSASLGIMRRPFATVLHGIDLAEPYNSKRMFIYRRMFRYGTVFLPVCTLFRHMAVSSGAEPTRTMVTPMGVDPRAIPFVLRDWENAPQGPRIITVGRLVEKKGIEYGIRALAELHNRAPALPWQWDIIGDGVLRSDLEQFVGKLGIAGRVTFRGAISHQAVKSALAQGHLFLLPSVTSTSGDMESMPVVLKEAMAAGLTIITTRHSGIPDLVEDGVNGLMADERDVATLSRHLEWAIRNPASCAELACAARLTVETRFDCAMLDEDLSKILRRVAQPNAALTAT